MCVSFGRSGVSDAKGSALGFSSRSSACTASPLPGFSLKLIIVRLLQSVAMMEVSACYSALPEFESNCFPQLYLFV